MATEFTVKEFDSAVERAAERVIEEKLKELMVRKNTPASTTADATTLHGPFHEGSTTQYGIFSNVGVRPDLWTTLARPMTMAQLLSANKSVYQSENLELMTGVTAAAGSNADSICGTPPTVGQGKICEQRYTWGRYYTKTTLHTLDDLGSLRDRREIPRNVLNAPPQNRNPYIPDLLYRLEKGGDGYHSQFQYQMWLQGVALERSLCRVIEQGATATAGANREHGWITEFAGYDGQVKTGYADAGTGTLCPAADSSVATFGAAVTGTAADGRNIQQMVSDEYFGVKQRAIETGLDGVNFAVVMRPDMWRPFVGQWSCQYDTDRCASTNAGQPFVNNVTDTNARRIEMQRGMFMWIDGEQVPVIFDECIPRAVVGNQQFVADMFILPVVWQGLPLLRMEYFPLDNPQANEFMNAFGNTDIMVVNDGMYAIGYENTAFCKEFHFFTKMRLILETPWLASRIDNIEYTNRAPIKLADPTDTFYYKDGGDTFRF